MKKRIMTKVDGYLAGLQHGKTMAEVDAYYEGLLREIKDLKKLLKKGDDNGQTNREKVNSRG